VFAVVESKFDTQTELHAARAHCSWMMAEPRIDDRDRNVGAAQDLGIIPQLREQLEKIGFPVLPHLMVTKQSFEGVS
jgi:hypothetical protein